MLNRLTPTKTPILKSEVGFLCLERRPYDYQPGKFNISIRTLREYIKRGDLKTKKIGRAYYMTERNLLEFLEKP
jgi:hypothetical protein